MSFRNSQWLFPIAVTLHNAEEAIWLPRWAERNAARLPVQVSAGEFRFAVVILTVAAFAVTYLSYRHGRESLWSYLLFGGTLATLVNVAVPHVPASLIFHSYTPGVITAVAINLPLMSILALCALRERWVSGRKALLFAVAVPVATGLAIFLLFFRRIF